MPGRTTERARETMVENDERPSRSGGFEHFVRVAVVGAGAMGSLFAARLALAGEDVTLVSRPSPHLEIIQQAGLTLVENDGSR